MQKVYSKLMLLFGLLFLMACTKKETITLTGNEPPVVNNVPAIKIENYVNRIFIDLLGREPLDTEMATEVQLLRDADLDVSAREVLIEKLQTSTDFIEGDSSYLQAYAQNFYNLAKVRCIEGASEAEINTFFNNAEPEDSIRLVLLKESRRDFQNGLISANEVFGRMAYNLVYDKINMNSFNFVNATFDNLLFRFPTNDEFTTGFNMVEHQMAGTFFGELGSNKTDYVNIIVNTQEMFEGLIIWAYQQLLARPPTTHETAALLEDFLIHKEIRLIQKVVMVTDEYANF